MSEVLASVAGDFTLNGDIIEHTGPKGTRYRYTAEGIGGYAAPEYGTAVNGLRTYLNAAFRFAEFGGTPEIIEGLFDQMLEAQAEQEHTAGGAYGQAVIAEQAARDSIVAHYIIDTDERANDMWRYSFFHNRHIDPDDFIQAAQLGVMKAIRNYSQTPAEERHANPSFTSFVHEYVYGDLQNERFRQIFGHELPGGQSKQDVRDYHKARDQLARKLHRQPSLQELSAHMEMEPEDVFRLAAVSFQSIRFSTLWADPDNPEGSVEEYLYQHVRELNDPEERSVNVLTDNENILVERALAFLSAGQRKVLMLKFGFDDEPAMDYPEIGYALQISSLTAKVMANDGLRELRAIMPQVAAGTFDIGAWAKEHPKRKNVLTFMASIGHPVDPDKFIFQLKGQSARVLQELMNEGRITEREMLIATAYFGLGDDDARIARDIAEQWQLKSTSSIGTITANVTTHAREHIAATVHGRPKSAAEPLIQESQTTAV